MNAVDDKLKEQSGASDRQVQHARFEMDAEANAKITTDGIEQKMLALCKGNPALISAVWTRLFDNFGISAHDKPGLLKQFKSVERAQAQFPDIVEGARRELEANAPPAPPPEFLYFSGDELNGKLDKDIDPETFILELKRMAVKNNADLGSKITVECGLAIWPLLEQVSKVYGFIQIVANMRLDNDCFSVRVADKKAVKG